MCCESHTFPPQLFCTFSNAAARLYHSRNFQETFKPSLVTNGNKSKRSAASQKRINKLFNDSKNRDSKLLAAQKKKQQQEKWVSRFSLRVNQCWEDFCVQIIVNLTRAIDALTVTLGRTATSPKLAPRYAFVQNTLDMSPLAQIFGHPYQNILFRLEKSKPAEWN